MMLALIYEQCQRKHWSVHKTSCNEDKAPYLRALGKNLSRCPNILHYLSLCAALALGLNDDDTTGLLAPDRTLSVCVNMIFVPSDIKDVKRLLQLGPDHFVNSPINGILQFTDMVCVENPPKDMLHGGHLTQARFWDTLSTLTDPKDFMMIDISMMNGPTNVGLSLPYRLGSLAEELKTKQFAHIDSSADLSVNVANSLRYALCQCTIPHRLLMFTSRHLNDHLRADKDNVYDLRCIMRKCDKAPLVDAFLDMHATTWTPEQKKRVRDRVIGPDIPRLWGNLPSPRPSSRH